MAIFIKVYFAKLRPGQTLALAEPEARHPLHKVMNRNTIKVSYRCMPNMQKAISSHNIKVCKGGSTPQPIPNCNCLGGLANCPVQGQCQTKGVIYQASVTRGDDHSVETYTGLTSRSFKERLYEHRSDFNNIEREGTSLSEYVWRLKKRDIPYSIQWKILQKSQAFNPSTKKCNLCVKEVYHIIFKPGGASLNKRSEFFSTCRHRLKDLLSKV